jgi:L-fuculose-phosphate aldolase
LTDLDRIAREVIEAGKEILAKGFVTGTSGNVSARIGADELLIKPSGIPYHEIEPSDLVRMSLDGRQIGGTCRPSTEWPFHTRIMLARPDVNAVIHTHAIYSTAVATARRKIPLINDGLMLAAGGEVEVADYARTGSHELAENLVRALGPRNAVLWPNHGAVVVGPDMQSALYLTELLERTSLIFILSSLIGTPIPVGPDALDETTRFVAGNYGQRNERSTGGRE